MPLKENLKKNQWTIHCYALNYEENWKQREISKEKKKEVRKNKDDNIKSELRSTLTGQKPPCS